MEQFWQSLEAIERFYLLSAILGTVALVLSLVIQLFGGDFDLPVDDGTAMSGEATGVSDSDVSFQILSWMGLSSFFTMFGFVALAMSKANNWPFIYSFPGGVLSGLAHFFFIRFLFKSFQRLQSTGKKS